MIILLLSINSVILTLSQCTSHSADCYYCNNLTCGPDISIECLCCFDAISLNFSLSSSSRNSQSNYTLEQNSLNMPISTYSIFADTTWTCTCSNSKYLITTIAPYPNVLPETQAGQTAPRIWTNTSDAKDQLCIFSNYIEIGNYFSIQSRIYADDCGYLYINGVKTDAYGNYKMSNNIPFYDIPSYFNGPGKYLVSFETYNSKGRYGVELEIIVNYISCGVSCSECSADKTNCLICAPGYYLNTSCLPCAIDCETCENSSVCLTCKDKFAIPTAGEFCDCPSVGLYKLSSDPTTCSLCPNECLTCSSSTLCNTCKVKHANPTLYGTCECDITASFYNSSCVCPSGFFMNNYTSMNHLYFFCDKCPVSCKECISAEPGGCLSCSGLLTFDSNHLCTVCPKGMFLQNMVCSNCSTECLECSEFNFCLKCANPEIIADPDYGTCDTTCLQGQINYGDLCFDCPHLCKSCTTLNSCELCASHSNWNGESCECYTGYHESDFSCVFTYFEFELTVNNNNELLVAFSIPPNVSLNLVDFKIQVGGNPEFNVIFNQLSLSEYSFLLNFKGTVKEGTQVNVTILKQDLESIYGSKLFNYYANGQLLDSNNTSIITQITNQMSVSIKSATFTALFSAVIGNPSTGWLFINNIQFLAYLPLNANPLTPDLINFLTSMNNFNFIPNPFAIIFNPNDTSIPYTEAYNYGINSSVYWINLGSDYIIIIIFLVLLPILCVFYRISQLIHSQKWEKSFEKLLKNYRYSIFLRFLIQSYLDLGIYSLVQLRSKNFDRNASATFNYAFAIITIVINKQIIVVFSGPFVWIFSVFNYKKIIDKENKNFQKKFESLFGEFKNNKGFLSTQFYFVFFIRRLFYMLTQVFLNEDLILQASTNIFFSVIQTAYVIYYRPFKDLSALNSAVVGEICITMVVIISSAFLFELSSNTLHIIEIIIVGTILGCMGFQLLVSIYNMIKRIKVYYHKTMRKRAQQIGNRLENRRKVQNFETIVENIHGLTSFEPIMEK